MDRPHTGPHLRHHFVRLGPGEALEMRLKLSGCSGGHTPAHAPSSLILSLGLPCQQWASVLCRVVPFPSLQGKAPRRWGRREYFYGRRRRPPGFSDPLSEHRLLRKRPQVKTADAYSPLPEHPRRENPTFLNKLETLTPQKDPPTTGFPGASPSTAAFKIFTLLSCLARRLQNRPGEGECGAVTILCLVLLTLHSRGSKQ